MHFFGNNRISSSTDINVWTKTTEDEKILEDVVLFLDDDYSDVSPISEDSTNFRIRMMVNSTSWAIVTYGPPSEVTIRSRSNHSRCCTGTKICTATHDHYLDFVVNDDDDDENDLECCDGIIVRQDIPCGDLLESIPLPLQSSTYRRRGRIGRLKFISVVSAWNIVPWKNRCIKSSMNKKRWLNCISRYGVKKCF